MQNQVFSKIYEFTKAKCYLVNGSNANDEVVLLSSAMLFHIITVLLSAGVSTGQIPLSEFYQYGSASGDSQLPSLDDASTSIPIQFDYPFFGSIYREVNITTNGLLLFGAGTSAYVPVPFPTSQIKCIATYWTDSDLRRGGTVFYRETHDPNLLDRISQEVRTRLVKYSTFTSQWALIVTFDRVSAYGCSGSSFDATNDTCQSACSKVITHQAILTSNGINSFAIFNFNQLDYTVGHASCTGHAQIGFNAGDGKRFYIVPSSHTANIKNVGLTGSNVGVPGKWMFATDGADIAEGCNSRGLLEIFPRRVLYFGGEEVTIIGPCFNESVITVFFEQTSTLCRVQNGLQAICTVPLLNKPGRNSVRLVTNSIAFEGFVMAINTDDRTVKENTFELQTVDNGLSQFLISWSDKSNVSSDVTFNGYQRNYYISKEGAIVSQGILVLNYGTYRNIGSLRFMPVSSGGSSLTTIIREIMVSGIQRRNRLIASKIVQVDKSAQDFIFKHCINWFNTQPSENEMRNIINEVSLRSPCPPSVQSNFPQTMGNFELDSSCNPSVSGQRGCQFFHPGAIGCYTSINNSGRPAAQCCYGRDNSLLLGPPGGGTLDFKDSSVSIVDHFLADVLPYLTCCKLNSNLCNKYYEKRPSIDSRNFRPPTTGNGNGDPHFRTLDGTSYTFNPVGEFIYLQTTDGTDTIQTRISQYVDQGGISKQACYFSGFVIKSRGSDTVQVELNALNMFTFRINGQSLTLDNGYWSFNEISVNNRNNSVVILHTTTGIDLEIRILSRMLHVIYTLPETFKGRISGLIGDWDGNIGNDLKLPNGTWISANSSNADIHYMFGMAWSTTNQTSLFTYPTGLAWSDYQNLNFVPDFSVPTAIEACGGDHSCNYDARATGDVNIGLNNIAIRNQADERNKLNTQISQICPTQVSVINGKVKIDRNSTGSTVRYTVECDAGYDLIGSSSVSCVNGAFQPLAVCQPKTTNDSQRSAYIPSIIIAAIAARWTFVRQM